jgi:hypothetical protein
MKLKLTVIIASVLCVASARAQEVVYDPSLHIQNIINQAANIAKYVEMIDNQVQQINTLTSQLQELQNYNKAFGDPSKIVNITGVSGLVQDIEKTGAGQTLGALENLSQGIDALKYDANGLYHNVGQTFATPNGNIIAREQDRYRPFASINKTTQNFADVYADVIARRRALKQDIAATTEKLQSAATASEAQKLTGVLVGLNAELAATDKELDQAFAVSLVQDAENRNDKEKQDQARTEEQQAEFSESIKKYNDTMRLSVTPPAFPEAAHE